MKKQINIKEILKNKVSLRNAYKFRFCAWAAVFLCSEILLMLQNFGAGIVAINIIRLLICMIIISMFTFSIKLNIEKSDELSNMNTLKANMLTAKIIFSLLICSAIIIYVFDKTIFLTISPDMLFGWIMLIVSVYYALQNGLFLAIDGSEEDEAGDE